MRLVLFLLAFVFTSCSLGPTSSPQTARALGKKNWEISAGLEPMPYASVGYGVTEEFDAGLSIERQIYTLYSLWGKYAINSREVGWSQAISGGAFTGAFRETDTYGAFAGPLVSYKKDWFESNFKLHFYYVEWKDFDLTSSAKDDFLAELLNWQEGNMTYFLPAVELNFWLTKKFALSVAAKGFYFNSSDIVGSNFYLVPGLSFIWRL